MTTHDREPLAEAVLRRKAAILAELGGVLESRVRARRDRQATAAAFILGVAMLAIAAVTTRAPRTIPHQTPAPALASDPFTDTRFTIVRALPDAPIFERIDDNELATELQAAGFQGGFARTNTGVFIASR